MRTLTFFLLMTTLASAGCGSEGASPQPGNYGQPIAASAAVAQTPIPVAAAPPVAVQPAQAAVSAATSPVQLGPPGVAEIVPPIPRLERGMMDHAETYGWAADSSDFGYCVVSGGSGGTTCEFVRPNGKVDELTDFDPDKGEIDEAKTKKIRARISQKGYRHGPVAWPYATDLELTWKAAGGDEAGEGEGAAVLRVGALVRGEEKPVLPIVIKAKGALGIHPETIALSPDGKYMGVLGHGFAGEFSDSFEIRVMPVAILAGRVLNDTGFAAHKKGNYARSAELFKKAAAADPENRIAPYNYACALAKLNDPGTREALARAIAVDGDKVKQKAAKDTDFDGVRGQGWFAQLVQ